MVSPSKQRYITIPDRQQTGQVWATAGYFFYFGLKLFFNGVFLQKKINKKFL